MPFFDLNPNTTLLIYSFLLYFIIRMGVKHGSLSAQKAVKKLQENSLDQNKK